VSSRLLTEGSNQFVQACSASPHRALDGRAANLGRPLSLNGARACLRTRAPLSRAANEGYLRGAKCMFQCIFHLWNFEQGDTQNAHRPPLGSGRIAFVHVRPMKWSLDSTTLPIYSPLVSAQISFSIVLFLSPFCVAIRLRVSLAFSRHPQNLEAKVKSRS